MLRHLFWYRYYNLTISEPRSRYPAMPYCYSLPAGAVEVGHAFIVIIKKA